MIIVMLLIMVIVMNSREYWIARFLYLENTYHEDTEKYLYELFKFYDNTSKGIQKDLAYWFLKFAKDNQITYIEAQKTLKRNELKEFHSTIDEYISSSSSLNFSNSFKKELDNMLIRKRVTRLESLQTQLKCHVETLYSKQTKDIEGFLKTGFKKNVYKTAYEIEKGLNVGVTLNKYNESEVEQIIGKPWATDEETFSERLWGRKRKLVSDLVQTDLPQALVKGESTDKITKRWVEKLGVDKRAVERIIRTERSAVASISTLESYKKLGVKKYQLLATLDLRTSQICQSIDLKIFDLKNYSIGATAPPFHPNCRTTTVPYFDDEFTVDEKRAAKDKNGNTIHVPATMTFDKWQEKYVT